MQASKTKQSILIVTGMHRSGTSFTSSLLQNAGLDIGRTLLGPGNGNVKGFFECLDFVEFHQTLLRAQGLNEIGWTLQEINVEEQYIKKAKEVISKSSQSSIWGWKDPRTTLFLDFWIDLLPDANFLLIYRSPWEVVDSLYRRGDDIFLNHPELAVEIWMHYNQKILDFYSKFPDRCLLVSIYNIANRTQEFIDAINSKFEVNLVTPTSDIYEQSLFHTQVSDDHKPTLVSYYFPKALDIYQQLNTREALSNGAPDLLRLEQTKNSPDKAWAFEDWAKVRHLERQVKSLQSKMERSRSQIQKAQAELESLLGNVNTELSEED